VTRKVSLVIVLVALATTGWVASYSLGEADRPHERKTEPRERDDREEEEREEAERWREEHELEREMEEVERTVHQMRMYIELLETVRELAFPPETAATIGIMAIKDDLDLPPEETIKQLNEVLGKTKSIGLRNSIRLGLKDAYEETGQTDKLLALLKDMIAENDAVLAEEEKAERK